MGYKDFKKTVKSLGGVWATEDVYFTQARDGYYASYKPMYPASSREDAVISDITSSGAYLRGNYELVRFDKGAGKVTATYFASFEDLEKYIKYEELVKRLRGKARLVREYNDTGMLEDKSADAIEELSAKQTPMKVAEIHVDEYFCSSCGAENNCDQGYVYDAYCPVCGQRLWAEPPKEE